jgi:GNAT superfamily N-acetyltransferase
MPDPVVRPLTDADRDVALDLIHLAWPEIPRACNEQMILRDPWRDRQRAFGAFVADRLVSHARFHFRPIRIGRATLHMIGVCEVVTHPDFRRRGLGHAVLKQAIAWMESSHHHFCLLHTGVHPFYAALGWGTIHQPLYYLPANAIPRLGPGRCEIEHISIESTPPDFAAIYDQSAARHPHALLRTTDYWRQWPHWAAGNLWFGLLDNHWSAAVEDGRILAYGGVQRSLKRQDSVGIVEACALPHREDALLDLLDDLLARCRDAGGDPIELNLAVTHPAVTHLAPLARRTTASGVMIRVIDLPGLLRALEPELDARASGISGPARVRLECELGSATLLASPGHVSLDDRAPAPVARLTSAGLASLLLGYRSAADLAESDDLEADPAVLDLLDILFPCLRSFYWQIDHF